MITAKVTFGNINALDRPVENVTPVTNSGAMNRRLLGDEAAALSPSKKRVSSSCSETSLLSDQSETSSATAAASTTIQLASTCIVDENVFKIPPNYRCINYYYDTTTQLAAAQPTPAVASHYHRPAGGNVVDDDDILLQLAIQQSLSDADTDQEQLTALEVLAGSRQGGMYDFSSRRTAC